MPSNKIRALARKFLKGKLADTDTTELERWYEDCPDPKPEWQLNNESRDELKSRIYQRIHQEITPVKALYPLWAKVAVAATVILALSITFLKIQLTPPALELTTSSASGEIRKIRLPDHSLVWLKGNSSLRYPAHFSDSTRDVTLSGEALFEISKDRQHPFIINTGGYITRVLGTSFNIRSDSSGAFKLTVLTGKVQVTSSNFKALKQPVMITPGEEFDVRDRETLAQISISPPDRKEAVVSGTQYPMNFNEISFDEIKRRIEQKFDVVIKTDASSYKQCRISANVTDQSLDNTLRVICAAIGAEYNVNKNLIMIAGGGCN